jgi:RNA polymerase sporulation-specific sigma factor
VIGRFEFAPSLDAETQQRVLAAAKAGDADAMREALSGNMRLVGLLATRFAARHGCPELLEELVQAAVCDDGGLVRAVQRYDPSLGFKFSPFAGRWLYWTFLRVLERERERNAELRRCGVEPDDATSADEDPSDGYTEDAAIATLDASRTSAVLADALAALTPLQRELVTRRFALGGRREEPFGSIATSLGLRRPRAQEQLDAALASLRLALADAGLDAADVLSS